MAPIVLLDTRIAEHTHWLCNNAPDGASTMCGQINEVMYRDCEKCGHVREEGTEALNQTGYIIGELERVFEDGREHWDYFHITTNIIDMRRFPINSRTRSNNVNGNGQTNGNGEANGNGETNGNGATNANADAADAADDGSHESSDDSMEDSSENSRDNFRNYTMSDFSDVSMQDSSDNSSGN